MKVLSILLFTTAFPILAFGQQLPPFKVNTIQIKGLSSIQTEKMKRAVNIFEKVMNDTEFQKELKEKNFESDRDNDEFAKLTTAQIVEKIYTAQEHYKTDADNTADIYWTVKKKSFWQRLGDPNCKTIGYGNEDEKEIYSYTCFVDDDKDTSLSEIVGHIAHEWSHKLGFVHHPDDSSKRNSTIPYAFGYLVAKYAEKYI